MISETETQTDIDLQKERLALMNQKFEILNQLSGELKAVYEKAMIRGWLLSGGL